MVFPKGAETCREVQRCAELAEIRGTFQHSDHFKCEHKTKKCLSTIESHSNVAVLCEDFQYFCSPFRHFELANFMHKRAPLHLVSLILQKIAEEKKSRS